ncbi:MAG: hypothetical protein QW625_01635 [Candidatus Nanoarchaeia archaeon]
MAKAQGLPLSFIVIAAISALVLILVVAFTMGGLGGLFKQIGAQKGEELDAVRTACSTACAKAQTTATTLSAFRNSEYCTKRWAIDLNKDGKINQTTETNIHCYDAAVGISCTVQIGNDFLTESNCTSTAGGGGGGGAGGGGGGGSERPVE